MRSTTFYPANPACKTKAKIQRWAKGRRRLYALDRGGPWARLADAHCARRRLGTMHQLWHIAETVAGQGHCTCTRPSQPSTARGSTFARRVQTQMGIGRTQRRTSEGWTTIRALVDRPNVCPAERMPRQSR